MGGSRGLRLAYISGRAAASRAHPAGGGRLLTRPATDRREVWPGGFATRTLPAQVPGTGTLAAPVIPRRRHGGRRSAAAGGAVLRSELIRALAPVASGSGTQDELSTLSRASGHRSIPWGESRQGAGTDSRPEECLTPDGVLKTAVSLLLIPLVLAVVFALPFVMARLEPKPAPTHRVHPGAQPRAEPGVRPVRRCCHHPQMTDVEQPQPQPIHHVFYGYDRTECEVEVERRLALR